MEEGFQLHDKRLARIENIQRDQPADNHHHQQDIFVKTENKIDQPEQGMHDKRLAVFLSTAKHKQPLQGQVHTFYAKKMVDENSHNKSALWLMIGILTLALLAALWYIFGELYQQDLHAKNLIKQSQTQVLKNMVKEADAQAAKDPANDPANQFSVSVTPEMVLQMTEQAAKGDSYAQVTLGQYYLMGLGVKRDPLKAREYIIQAYRQKNVEATRILARMMATGTGGPVDAEKAKMVLQKIAPQDPVARQMLASFDQWAKPIANSPAGSAVMAPNATTIADIPALSGGQPLPPAPPLQTNQSSQGQPLINAPADNPAASQ